MSELRGDLPNKLIVASNGLNGVVLSWLGADVEKFFAIYNDSYLLADLGLESAPAGISAWVGEVRYASAAFPQRPDDMPMLVGHFRPLTDEEWADLQAASTLA